MGLRDRINHPDRRQTAVTPAVERRDDVDRREPFVAPWRRRQLEQRDRLGNVAVTDLTDRAA